MEGTKEDASGNTTPIRPDMMCPSSPPPDAVWTLERILQNPPSAPKKRNHHPSRFPPPRHRRSLSNIPNELLAAWPSSMEDDSEDDNEGNALNPPVLLAPSSGSFSSSSSLSSPSSSSTLSPAGFHATVHAHRPSSVRPTMAPDPRLLFQHHSTSQLYARPAQKRTSRLTVNQTSTTALFMSSIHRTDGNGAQHHPGELWEEDRQGSTRHLFERTAGCWTSSPTQCDDNNSNSNDDDSRTS
jgi:hypothetical protein